MTERRIYTAAEHAAMAQFETEEAPKGLISSDENANALLDYLGDTPLTVTSIRAAVDAHVASGWKFYLSPQETAYKNALAAFCRTPHDVEVFEDWFSKMGRHLIVDLKTPQGLENAVKILQRCQGKQIHPQVLTLELQRAFATTTMHVVPTVNRITSPHSGKSAKWDKSEVSTPFFTGGRSYRNDPPTEGTLEASSQNTETYWRAKLESLRGQTHSATAGVQGLWITKPGTCAIDFPATYAARCRALEGPSGSI
jgi:hypothetical protein